MQQCFHQTGHEAWKQNNLYSTKHFTFCLWLTVFNLLNNKHVFNWIVSTGYMLQVDQHRMYDTCGSAWDVCYVDQHQMYAICGSASDVCVDQHYMYATCGSASDVCYMWISIGCMLGGCMLHVDQHRLWISIRYMLYLYKMYVTCWSASDVCYVWIIICIHVWISIGCMLGGCMLHVDQHRLWISIRYMLYLYKMYVTCWSASDVCCVWIIICIHEWISIICILGVDVCYKWFSIGSMLCVDQHLYQGGTVPLSKPVVWLNVNIIINQGSRKGATWAK